VEQRLLALVRPRVPVAVPDWRVVGSDLIAYPRLPGRPAYGFDPVTGESRWVIDHDSPPDHFLVGLGRFMAALHTVPAAEAVAAGVPLVPASANRGRYARYLEFGVAELGLHPAWVERLQRWLDRDDLWSESTVLLHGDLHCGHMLVDEAGALVGVIDWSDAEVGDPAREFVAAAQSLGMAAIDRLVAIYRESGGAWWPGLRAHVVEAIAFAPLATAYWCFDHDKPTYVEQARTRYAAPPDEADTAAT
jgi:macrolide phosphotransferase